MIFGLFDKKPFRKGKVLIADNEEIDNNILREDRAKTIFIPKLPPELLGDESGDLGKNDNMKRKNVRVREPDQRKSSSSRFTSYKKKSNCQYKKLISQKQGNKAKYNNSKLKNVRVRGPDVTSSVPRLIPYRSKSNGKYKKLMARGAVR